MLTLPQKSIGPVAIFWVKFRRFWAIFSKSTQNSEMLYTSLESPNIQHSESLSIKGVALSKKLSRPFKWNSNFFHSKRRGGFVKRATPFIDKDSESWITRLSNEVYNLSVAQVVREITAIEVWILIFFTIYLVKQAFFRSFNYDEWYL